MKINGKEYKISVLILLMEKEVGATVSTIETLLTNKLHNVTISVLLNGGESDLLKSLCNQYDFINYYESDKNLGVAGGRNFLFSTEECQASDIVMLMDNDVIVPVDYVENICTFLLSKKKSGIVGPVVADFNTITTAFSVNDLLSFVKRGPFGNKILKFHSMDIKRFMAKNVDDEFIYHMGTNENYYLAYFSIMPHLYRFFRRFSKKIKAFYPELKNDPALYTILKQGGGSLPVSNVIGASQVFRRSLLNEIGLLNDAFNPYGYEDTDFSIRAIKSGYKNYVTSDVWLLHGTDSRHKERTLERKMYIYFRGLTILSSTHFGKYRRKYIIFSILFYSIVANTINSLRNFKLPVFKNYFDGVHDGMEICSKHKIVQHK